MMSFWEASFLWRDAVIASVAVAVACSFVGVYAVLRRVVFLPAALSQTAGVGVALSFGLAAAYPGLAESVVLGPESLALAVTLVAAFGLGWMPEPRHLSREAIIGVAYVFASALVLIIGDRLPQESHEIDDVLFGHAVAVELPRMIAAVVVSGIVLVFHGVFMRIFVLVSFDRDTAIAHGVRVNMVDAALFLTMGLSIAAGTWTVGALPVFAFTVLPAAAALNLFHDMRFVFGFSLVVGAASAFFGYCAAWVFELPTGPSMVAVAFAIYLPTIVIKRFRRCDCRQDEDWRESISLY